MEKKRIIVDYSTLPDEVLEIMADMYPDGYDHDIFRFPNSKGEVVSAVRVETDEIIYLVKVSRQLREMVDEFEFDDDDDDDFEDEDVSSTISKNDIPKGVIPDDELEVDDDDDEEEEDIAFDDEDDDDE